MASQQETPGTYEDHLLEGPGPSNRLTVLADAFPLVLERIVGFLDDGSMENVRLVCPRLEQFMDNECRPYWERRWMGTIRHGNYRYFVAEWKAAVLRSPLPRLKAWALACERYFEAAAVRRMVSRRQVCCFSASVKSELDFFAVLENLLFT